MNNLTKYSIIFVTVVLYYAITPSVQYYTIVCLTLISLIGIPHGAADHKISASLNKKSNFFLFVTKYLLISVGYIIWWMFMPGKSFVFFLILSAFHFGQEFLEDMGINKYNLWEIMFWGAVILFSPILISYTELKSTIELVTQSSLPEIPSWLVIVLISLSIILSTFRLYWLKTKNKISSREFNKRFLNIAVLLILFAIVPFLIAFTLYFILFHSANSFAHQYKWLKSNTKNYSIKSFIFDLIPFSLLSLFGIVLVVLTLNPETDQELVSYFIVLISIITLPHTILFNQFYSLKIKS